MKTLLEQAHANLDFVIKSISKFEGVNFTIPQTRKIINHKRNENRFKGNYDYRVIWTLKEAFIKMEDKIKMQNNGIDHRFAKQINLILGEYDVINAGEYNTIHAKVDIGKIEYEPEFLSPDQSSKMIDDIALSNYSIYRVVDMFGKMIVHQLFNDANKRTALLFANTLLLKANLGFLNVEDMDSFSGILTGYYFNLLNKVSQAAKIFNNKVIQNFLIKEFTNRRQNTFYTVSTLVHVDVYRNIKNKVSNRHSNLGKELKKYLTSVISIYKINGVLPTIDKNINYRRRNDNWSPKAISCQLKSADYDILNEICNRLNIRKYELINKWCRMFIKR
ncbi:hypothetical protein FACS1894166_00550 [Bacilli bacterium]|nr:hypothetical protein FACS1894166_00550 [Bacilli bacterium]